MPSIKRRPSEIPEIDAFGLGDDAHTLAVQQSGVGEGMQMMSAVQRLPFGGAVADGCCEHASSPLKRVNDLNSGKPPGDLMQETGICVSGRSVQGLKPMRAQRISSSA
jgi:hypothetical protein